jgi:hypothetical protein
VGNQGGDGALRRPRRRAQRQATEHVNQYASLETSIVFELPQIFRQDFA